MVTSFLWTLVCVKIVSDLNMMNAHTKYNVLCIATDLHEEISWVVPCDNSWMHTATEGDDEHIYCGCHYTSKIKLTKHSLLKIVSMKHSLYIIQANRHTWSANIVFTKLMFKIANLIVCFIDKQLVQYGNTIIFHRAIQGHCGSKLEQLILFYATCCIIIIGSTSI